MKTIKIFALPSHATKDRTSGVDFARVIQPMQFLNGFEYEGHKFEVNIFDPNNLPGLNWMQVAEQYDIIFLNYINDPMGFAAMGLMARKNGRKIVFEVDDNLWQIKPDNTAYEVYKKGSEGAKNLTAIMNEVDMIVTTNGYLKNVILSETFKRKDQVEVLPNYIDLDGLYTHRSEFKDNGNIQLTHFGSTTHFIDLESPEFVEGISRIMRDYPNVTFKTIGATIPKFKMKWGHRYDNAFGHRDIYTWVKEKFPQFMDETDIMVVPLADTTYDKAKSAIKFLEASSALKPGVWQDIRQYQEVIEDGKNGFLARTADDWYNKIKKLIDDVELRRNMGKNAFETVQKDWQMKDHVADYAKAMIKALEMPVKGV